MIKGFFNSKFSKDKKLYQKLYNVLGFYPGRISLYKIAITHNSYRNSANKDVMKGNNERLEFLGDAVLGMVVAEKLYLKFPYQNEGFLTEMRSKIVGRSKLNSIGKKMGIHQLLQYDIKLKNNPVFIDAITGNAFESIIGAIYLDKGFDFTKKFIVNNILSTYIDFEELIIQELSYKAKLVKWAQKEKKKVDFNLKNIELENKRKIYEIAILIDGEEVIVSKNHSKKIAEELASEKFCLQMSI
ncbi:MAG TPA: ribonuclease III domain-containing protein [Bacteroidia bacterium]